MSATFKMVMFGPFFWGAPKHYVKLGFKRLCSTQNLGHTIFEFLTVTVAIVTQDVFGDYDVKNR